MLAVIWRESALDDLQEIVDYISEYDFNAAWRLHALMRASAERLSDHPYMYRTGRREDTREAVVHPNYILIYRVAATQVEILNVVHSRRQYPPE